MEKYGWSVAMFGSVDWESHHNVINQYPKFQRATIIKYLHGWLATKKRRWREGTFTDSSCPLCGEVEDRYHMFQCSCPQLCQIREERIATLFREIGEITNEGCKQVFQAGLASIFGDSHPPESTWTEWPRQLQDVYHEQKEIGWVHVMYSRLHRKWAICAEALDRDGTYGGSQWTRKVIRKCWTFGMDMWKV